MNAPVRFNDALTGTDSFRSEQINAWRIAFYGRCVALSCVALMCLIIVPWPGPIYVHLLLSVFALVGWLGYQCVKQPWGREWHLVALVIFDFLFLATICIIPNPLLPFDYPAHYSLLFNSFVCFFIILCGLAYIYRPHLVIIGGVAGAVGWTVAMFYLTSRSGNYFALPEDYTLEAVTRTFFDPKFINLGLRVQEITTLLICAGILALAVQRSRQIALRQISLAQERANLARYFPDSTVEFLAGKMHPFAEPKEQNAGVLFADIIGFTSWAEQHTPLETITYLRDVQRLLADEIFRNNGTLDKFIGDGLMATFGTTEDRPEEAAEAILAAISMLRSYEKWREGKSAEEGGELRLAIGVHFGPVILGDVGSEKRLEFAVLGDTVNVASRLEAATRRVGCPILFSEAVVKSARESGVSGIESIVQSLKKLDPIELKGKQDQIEIYTIG